MSPFILRRENLLNELVEFGFDETLDLSFGFGVVLVARVFGCSAEELFEDWTVDELVFCPFLSGFRPSIAAEHLKNTLVQNYFAFV